MKKTRAIDVIHAFSEIFGNFRFPERCLLDNGTPFNSKELAEYFDKCGVNLIHSSPSEWFIQHSTPHSTTGVAPAELLFGRNLQDKLPGFNTNNVYQYEGEREKDTLMERKGSIRISEEMPRNAQ
uniref:CSON014952 protein n=1 Tax=Culicoides sonorensis TaxID=179676 RepID=A0A336M0L7_CULSO